MSNPTTIAREPIKVIRDILVHELGLDEEQCVLSYEKFNIPDDNPGLYISLNYISGKAIGNNNYAVSDDADPTVPMQEIQEVSMRHVIQIDLLSFNADARIRKEEIPMALGSLFAEQQMEENLMQLARIPSEFVNTAALEETKILNRFTTTIVVTALHRKVKNADYYNKFGDPEVHANA